VTFGVYRKINKIGKGGKDQKISNEGVEGSPSPREERVGFHGQGKARAGTKSFRGGKQRRTNLGPRLAIPSSQKERGLGEGKKKHPEGGNRRMGLLDLVGAKEGMRTGYHPSSHWGT